MVKREDYLSKIRSFYKHDLIKVITGIRRCGKSSLLLQIINELKENKIDDNHIIYLNFDDSTTKLIKYEDKLNDYVVDKIKDDKKYYLFFDEIQLIENWEKTINSLKATKNVSIFITGSNSDLLSGELATLLSGRYVSFKIFPFSFKEVVEFKSLNENIDLEEIFNDYILWGGMPQRCVMNDEMQIKTYLQDVFDSIVMKDIMRRFLVKEVDLFSRIVEYVVTNPSQTFSVDNIVDYFIGDNRKDISKNTIYNYLEYMCSALLINKVDRYDVRGKRILTGKYKYYLTDLGLGQILNSTKKIQLGAYLENIVYNELVKRGFTVNIGSIVNGEIDFVATKHNEKIYIQVAQSLADEKVYDREFNAFNNINDNYPKYVITTDKIDHSHSGIIHKNIIKWLLEEDK